LTALARSDCAGPVNIGNPDEVSVLHIAELIRDLAGSESPIHFLPAGEDDPQRRCPDITVAREQLGWRPRISYRDGLEVTVNWFRERVTDGTATSAALQGS
jgi:nucleoside-diphosphate-sugar epimerase